MLLELPRTESAPENARITDAEAQAMVRAVIRLFDNWQVSDNQARDILGGLAPRTYARWKTGEIGRIDRDLATRLSLLMGIHKGLRYLFSDAARGYAWVKKPSPLFSGQSPVDVMAAGDIFSLARVRAWLDAERGG